MCPFVGRVKVNNNSKEQEINLTFIRIDLFELPPRCWGRASAWMTDSGWIVAGLAAVSNTRLGWSGVTAHPADPSSCYHNDALCRWPLNPRHVKPPSATNCPRLSGSLINHSPCVYTHKHTFKHTASRPLEARDTTSPHSSDRWRTHERKEIQENTVSDEWRTNKIYIKYIENVYIFKSRLEMLFIRRYMDAN